MVADYVELLIGETRSVQDAGGQRNGARSLRPRHGRALPRPAGFSGSRASGTLGDHRSAIHFLLSAFSRGWQKAARQSRCMPWIRKGNGCLQGHPVLTCRVASRSSRLFCESPAPARTCSRPLDLNRFHFCSVCRLWKRQKREENARRAMPLLMRNPPVVESCRIVSPGGLDWTSAVWVCSPDHAVTR